MTSTGMLGLTIVNNSFYLCIHCTHLVVVFLYVRPISGVCRNVHQNGIQKRDPVTTICKLFAHLTDLVSLTI